MKHATLLAAAALVLLSNALVLIHAARNRSGAAEAEITLTDAELTYHRDPDESGVILTLRWNDPNTGYSDAMVTQEEAALSLWLDQPKLEELGFDCSVPPSDRRAAAFYSRQSARTGFVALADVGVSPQSWLARRNPDRSRTPPSRLVAIGAGHDAAALRRRHPDRNSVLILPAIIRIWLLGGRRSQGGREEISPPPGSAGTFMPFPP